MNMAEAISSLKPALRCSEKRGLAICPHITGCPRWLHPSDPRKVDRNSRKVCQRAKGTVMPKSHKTQKQDGNGRDDVDLSHVRWVLQLRARAKRSRVKEWLRSVRRGLSVAAGFPGAVPH